MAGGIAGQQGGDRVAGPGLAQRPQQPGDGLRVVEAGVAGGPVGQGGDRVAGPGLAQLPSSQATAPGSSRLAWPAGSRAGQGGDRVAGPGLAQLLQQVGDGPRVVEAGLAGGIAVQPGR